MLCFHFQLPFVFRTIKGSDEDESDEEYEDADMYTRQKMINTINEPWESEEVSDHNLKHHMN